MTRAFRANHGFRQVTVAEPLPMPDQKLNKRFVDPAAPKKARASHSRLSRLAVFLVPPPFAVAFGWATAEVLGADGRITTPDALLAILSGFAVYWMAFSVVSTFCGMFWRAPVTPVVPVEGRGLRIAILLPLYGEDPVETLTPALALLESLSTRGHAHRFSLHVLSDTRNNRAALDEAALVASVSAKRHDMLITYRHRTENTDFKQGNIRDWISRQGGSYDAALILDSDSVMGRATVLTMADSLAADPGCALVQTMPVVGGGETVWQRMQSFASRVYGGPHGRGFAMWTGSEGNFLGHNALVRLKAFAACAGLPHLSGPRPLGGVIQSHDFVEAALLRRAGWTVRMLPEAYDSHEDAPANLISYIRRDARWCQGNLQHVRLLTVPGLNPVSRLHFASGAMAYIGSVVLAAILLLWMLSDQGRIWGQGTGLEPVLAGTVAFLLFAPRFMGLFDYIWRVGVPKGRRLAFVGLWALETIIAVLTAPVMMVHHTKIILRALTGTDTGWPQHGKGHQPWWDLLKFHAIETALGLGLIGAMVMGMVSVWMAPVALGLALAVPVSRLVGADGRNLAVMPLAREA